MIYYINPLQSENDAEYLEETINQKQKGKYVEIDYENNQLHFSDKTDLDALHKVLDFTKVIYSDSQDVIHSAEDDDDHSHSHGSGDLAERNTKIVFFLNAGFAIAEFIFGYLFNSVALLSDAVHDTGDALSIGLAWLFQKLSNKDADEEYTFGYKRYSPLGAIITSIVLILGSVFMIFNSIPVLFNPTPINYQGLFWMAIIAIAIKGYAMRLMGKGSSKNEEMLNLHMLEDILGWLAVLAMSIILNFTDWYILDPIVSIIIAGYILYETIPRFIETTKIFFETTPDNIDLKKLAQEILSIDQVNNLSHFHVWTFDGEENIANVTISVASSEVKDHEQIKKDIREILFPYNLTHSTIEIIVDEKGILSKQ